MNFIQFTVDAGPYILAIILWLLIAGLLGAGIFGLYSAIKYILKPADAGKETDLLKKC